MSNLKDRLRRIKEQKKIAPLINHDISPLLIKGWENCGEILKRQLTVDLTLNWKGELPLALPVLIPDLQGKILPALDDFLFFDLETTGLSGGAGTVAFLAAFGRFISGNKLQISQYLLLDYPGEIDFLENLLKEINNSTNKSIIVSYNGKCFDAAILKTRCIMKSIEPPEFLHADLLHPARRLWKNIISGCSQSTIETQILGLDRSGDTPGSLAPEIWFDFLKTGKTERLLDICDHNSADISGLATMLLVMISIADNPFSTKLTYDIERLALYWRDFLKKNNTLQNSSLVKIGNELIHNAHSIHLKEKIYPRISLIYAQDLLKNGNYKEGRKILLEIANNDYHYNLRAIALRTLAIDSERRLKNYSETLEFSKQGLELININQSWQSCFSNRIKRLEKKLNCN
jgi:uncharacterized protein YprB with RNaseH-like and TPR domain